MSYSQGYAHTLVIMTTVVSLIMLIIGSNIARAFALVGALSVIRFRNAMKESRDVGFIFLGMAVGMAVGTRFYLLAVFATAVLSAFIVALYKFNMFAKEIRERILRVQVPADLDHEAVLEEPFLQVPRRAAHHLDRDGARGRAERGRLLGGDEAQRLAASAARGDPGAQRQPESNADPGSARGRHMSRAAWVVSLRPGAAVRAACNQDPRRR